MSTYQLRRGADRAQTRTEWLDSRHSFAFGSHYDPDNTGFGVLLAHNCDLLQPGPGYPVHAHRDVEILTWVMAGSLVHSECSGTSGAGTSGAGTSGAGTSGAGTSGAGTSGAGISDDRTLTVIAPGQLHHLSAGSGIRHTEFSADDQPVQVVQMWLSPDEFGLPPSSQLVSVGDRLDSGELVEIASGVTGRSGDGVLRIRQRAAALWAARLPAGATVTLPTARYLHLYLAAGSVTVESGDGRAVGVLAAGDALRITEGGAERVSADQPAELLVWRMQAGIG